MARVYLSLGCNLGDRLASLERALAELAALGQITACSSVYETEPWGEPNQPDFLNLCCGLETALAAEPLHAELKAIEARVGRVPGQRWGPRVIDVDLLTYDDLVLRTPRLTIPHPRIAGRAFVLAPLAEIAPALVIPGLPRPVAELAASLAHASPGVRVFAPPPIEPAQMPRRGSEREVRRAEGDPTRAQGGPGRE